MGRVVHAREQHFPHCCERRNSVGNDAEGAECGFSGDYVLNGHRRPNLEASGEFWACWIAMSLQSKELF